MQTQSFHSQTPLFQGFPLPKRMHQDELWVSSRTEVPVFGAETPSQMLHLSFGEGDKGGEDQHFNHLGEVWYAEFWEYDASRWDIDPIDYPFQSPYATFDGNPIAFSDPLGLAATGDGDGKDANGRSGKTPKVTKKDIRVAKKLERELRKQQRFDGIVIEGKRLSNIGTLNNRLNRGEPAVIDSDPISYQLWYQRRQDIRREANKYQFQPSAGDVFSTLATAATIYFAIETGGLGPAAVELLLDQSGVPNPKDILDIVKALFKLGKTGFNLARKWLPFEPDPNALNSNFPVLRKKFVTIKPTWSERYYDTHNRIMDALEHIWVRHSFGSTYENVSRFSSRFSKSELKGLITESLKNIDRKNMFFNKDRNNWEITITKNFNVGVNQEGKPTDKIKIILDRDFKIITAFPL